MKPIQARDNARKLKVNPYQSKNAQSQSPLHKKLLKKIEMTYKEPSNKYDLSLKEDLLAHEPPEDDDEEEPAVDFRVEIERRYAKSMHNQIYTFPLKRLNDSEDVDDSQISSVNDSFETLKYVTVYDLNSQNNKRKQNRSTTKQPTRMTVTDDNRTTKSTTNLHRLETEPDDNTPSSSADWKEEEKSGIPLELRIRDKSSATYKKLLQLLEHQLNPKPESPEDLQPLLTQSQTKPKAQYHQPAQEQKSKAAVAQPYVGVNVESYGVLTTQEDVEVHRVDQYKKKMERNAKSQGRHCRVPYNLTEFQQRQIKALSGSGLHGVKKNLSQEKVAPKGDIVQVGSSAVEKNFSYLSSSTAKGETKTTVDLNKMTQEGFKKLYSSNLMRSITPQYNKSNTNIKESAFRTNTQENHSGISTKAIMDTLYQKAKNDVLNHKLKVPGPSANYYHVKNTTNSSNSTTKRDENAHEAARKTNFNTFYGSPDVAVNKSAKTIGLSSQNNIAKKDSVRAFQISKKPNEGPIYASYDFTSKPKIAKQPSFKIEGNKRGQTNRETTSSARSRKIKTPDRVSEVLNTDPGIRNSYEMPPYSSILNSSTQKNTEKKKIGFTPNSTAKNLSFTKTFFSYK